MNKIWTKSAFYLFTLSVKSSITKKIPSKLEVAPPPKCGLGEWVIPLRLLQLLEHLAVLKIFNIAHKMMIA